MPKCLQSVATMLVLGRDQRRAHRERTRAMLRETRSNPMPITSQPVGDIEQGLVVCDKENMKIKQNQASAIARFAHSTSEYQGINPGQDSEESTQPRASGAPKTSEPFSHNKISLSRAPDGPRSSDESLLPPHKRSAGRGMSDRKTNGAKPNEAERHPGGPRCPRANPHAPGVNKDASAGGEAPPEPADVWPCPPCTPIEEVGPIRVEPHRNGILACHSAPNEPAIALDRGEAPDRVPVLAGAHAFIRGQAERVRSPVAAVEPIQTAPGRESTSRDHPGPNEPSSFAGQSR